MRDLRVGSLDLSYSAGGDLPDDLADCCWLDGAGSTSFL